MKLLRRIALSLGIVLFALCCGAVLLLNRPTLGWQALSVPTGSMRPTVPPGSLVLVHRVSDSSLRVGDVITYINPLTMHGTITHRIIKTYKTGGQVPTFVTKGDANPTADTPVVGGLVEGKMLWHVPDVGRWLMWGKSWVSIAILVYIPAVLLMIEEVQRLSEYFKLAQPYRLIGFRGRVESKGGSHKLAMGASLAAVFVLAGAFLWQPAFALLQSNTVSLAPNHLSVAAKTTPPTNCSVTNNNSVTVNNSSSQSSSTGNSSSSSNTTGGSATSGNASNTNSSSTSVTITNTGCH